MVSFQAIDLSLESLIGGKFMNVNFRIVIDERRVTIF